MTNTNIATCSIQNVSASVVPYVQQFNQFARKTAEAIIGMSETIYQAKTELGKKDSTEKKGKLFKEFCQAIRYDAKSSAVRKLLQIGQMADMLKKHTDQLPNTWTTIYTLTQLGQETLERLISDQLDISTVSAKEAKGLLEQYGDKSENDSTVPEPVAKPKDVAAPEIDDSYSLTIRLESSPTVEKAVLLDDAIKNLLKTLQIKAQVCRSQAIDALLVCDSHSMLKAA